MEYREINALNQSILKKILQSPQAFLAARNKQEKREESIEEHFIFGSILDLMLTGTKQEFDGKYAVVDDSIKCTDSIKLVVDSIIEEANNLGTDLTDVTLDSIKDVILQHCKYTNYSATWKDETRVNKIIELGTKYFEEVKCTIGKIIISDSEYAKAVACKMALMSDKYTREFVVKKDKPNRDILDKFIIEFEWQGYNIKGELDRVIIDHNDKTIIPIDFKTTGKSVLGFNSDFWYYRYDFQAAVYKYGLTLHDDIAKYLDQDYKISDFLYIVVEKNLIHSPMIFRVNQRVIDIGFSGGTLSNGKSLDGFTQAIERYKYAEENTAWEYPVEYYENEGVLFIEL
jgi:hypothetical protein